MTMYDQTDWYTRAHEAAQNEELNALFVADPSIVESEENYREFAAFVMLRNDIQQGYKEWKATRAAMAQTPQERVMDQVAIHLQTNAERFR